MLKYNVIFKTPSGKRDSFNIYVDEYNNFSYEVVDIVNAILNSEYDIAEIIAIDFVCNMEDEEEE